MPTNLLPLIIGGGAGFVLSFLVGLMAGVPLGDVILRALFWGILLGGLGYGLQAFLKAQFPELFAEAPRPPAEAEEAEAPRGQAVDITMESEVPEGMPEGGDEFVEEVGETSAASLPEDPLEDGPLEGDGESDHDRQILEQAGGNADLDEMPELGTFADSFKAAEPSPESEASGGGTFGGKSVNVEGLEEDPAVVAQAVRTMIKKDT